MGGVFLDPPTSADTLAPVRAKIADAKVVCSTVPEIAGNRDIAGVGAPRDLADVDFAIVRASFAVAETGSVLLSDADLRVNGVAYLAQHLIVLLDPADIVVNLHHAIAGPSSATGTTPASTPAHPRQRISRGCSSTVRRACARFPSCQLREQLAVLPTETRPTETEEKSMIPNFQTQSLDIQHGVALLNDPVRNKGTAFTPDERKRLGLEGLLPAPTDTLDRQVERVLGHLDGKPKRP